MCFIYEKRRGGGAELVEEEGPSTTTFNWKKYDEMAKVFELNRSNFTFQRTSSSNE
jgi:hypothetical protein